MSHPLLHILGVGEQGDLHLIHDGRIVVEELGVQDLAQVADLEALVLGGFADADPVDVALAHVPDAFGAVDQVVDLAFENRLEVGLHLASGNFHPDAEAAAPSCGVDTTSSISGPTTVILPSSTSVDIARGDILEARRLVAAELDVGLLLADALAFEGRAVGHRNRHLGDFDLAAAHFQALLHDVIDGHVGDHMLVGADAGGQDLRDVGVGDGRESRKRWRPRRRRISLPSLRPAP